MSQKHNRIASVHGNPYRVRIFLNGGFYDLCPRLLQPRPDRVNIALSQKHYQVVNWPVVAVQWGFYQKNLRRFHLNLLNPHDRASGRKPAPEFLSCLPPPRAPPSSRLRHFSTRASSRSFCTLAKRSFCFWCVSNVGTRIILLKISFSSRSADA